MTTVLQVRSKGFVSTPFIERLIKRAFRYLQSGFSVHLQGPAGTGKTTLALHLADLLGRPIMLVFGDDEFKTSDLIGNQNGYTRKKVVDNFIHSVVKLEDEMRQNWVDSRLTLACREGFTLVYDEFNRSRPEVNNVLLSALEEKILALPPNANGNEYVRVSPNFRGIFTSNPEEYCGVHATQDALMDRLITINMPEPDELTQQEITIHKSGLNREDAQLLVRLVKHFRQKSQTGKSSGLRACLMIAKICQEHEITIGPHSDDFRDVCGDILLSRTKLDLETATQILWHFLDNLDHLDRSNVDIIDTTLASPRTASASSTTISTPTDSHAVSAEPLPKPGLQVLATDVRGSSNHLRHNNTNARARAKIQSPLEAQKRGDVNNSPRANAKNTVASVNATRNSVTNSSINSDETSQSQGLNSNSTQTEEQAQSQLQALPDSGGKAAAIVPTDSPEAAILQYLQSARGAHLSEIESTLGINRVQAVDALRSLTEKGILVVQRDDSKPKDSGRTIYRVHANHEDS